MVVDCGSAVTCFSVSGAKHLNLEVIPEPKVYQPAGNDNVCHSPGYVIVPRILVGDRTLINTKIPVCEVDASCHPAVGLIGLDLFPSCGFSVEGVPTYYPRHRVEDDFIVNEDSDSDNNDINKFSIPTEDKNKLLDAIKPLLDANANIPENSFCSHPAAVITLDTGEAKPVYMPQYRISDFMSRFIDTQIDKWDNSSVTVPAPADSPWNSPIIGALDRAAKRKGKDPRVCIDPRHINNLLSDDPRPLPNVGSVHRTLAGFTHITEIDLTKSFNQFRIHPDSQVKTTFTWRGKKRMFQGAPFGLKPLSQIFQGVIEQILQHSRDFATPFIDNIYVHTSGSLQDHIDAVKKVLQLLNDNNLRINMDKCFFGYTAVNVLGHVLSGTTKTPDMAKLSALRDWPQPQTGNDVEIFLGFTNYLREFVPCYAEIAAPLEKLRKQKALGALWTEHCQRSFEMFKSTLSSAPTLNMPLEGVEYCLATDASQYGVGWVLYQIDPSTQQPRYILFGAKSLNDSQTNYGACRRELLAIILALEHCRDYIYGNKFRLFTDHRSLIYLFTQKKLNYMQLNWIDTLLDYNFAVIHRPGVQNVLPDALSRMYSNFRAATRGECGPPIRSLAELPKFPDRELNDFINLRFQKKFVPVNDRTALMESAHMAGHFGSETLFTALWQKGYYWPHMRADCNKQVNSCLQCLRFNVGKAGYHPRQFIDAKFPFEHIAVDTITGFPTTARGNNVILVITDICTRFKLLMAQQTKSATETARNLWYCMCTFPTPKIIQSDNGTEFCNAIVKELTEQHGVIHKQVAAYNPRANGTAENNVGVSQRVLRKTTQGNLKDWDLFLPTVQLAMNAKPNDSTKTSPASLLFGMNVNDFSNFDKANSKLLTTHQLLERARHLQDVLRPEVQSIFRRKQRSRTTAVNAKLRQTKPLPTGSLVMLKDPTRSSKHEPYWLGPYRVIQQKKGGTYVLQNVDHSIFHREPPRDQLKLISSEANVPFEDIFYVERILDHKGTGSRRQYLVKWLNYPSSENTWEPLDHLDAAESYIQDYWQAREAQSKLK